ncbi:MAG: hypothetical protein JRH16_23370 [Deltaproteobacteria bacterium]|nr:hypothetical protein [Deltaproteobacteria bacterium]MBW2363358.1 hypothetical protein [Deltaproteobacteria bacterium]
MLIRSLAIALFVLLCGAVPAQAGVRVALMPIAVYAAGADSVYLQSGLAAMIAARLDQYEGVSVVRPEIGGAPPASVDAARVAAEAAGAGFVLFGSFTRFGDGASLDLRCARVAAPGEGEDAAARRLFIQSGKLAEIIPQLDTLAQKVARYALRSGAPRVAGAEDGKQPAPSNGPTASEYEALVQRVEELERTLIPAVAESAAEDETLVR